MHFLHLVTPTFAPLSPPLDPQAQGGDLLAYLNANLSLSLTDYRQAKASGKGPSPSSSESPSSAGEAAAAAAAAEETAAGGGGGEAVVREAQFLHRGGIVEYIELLCRDKTLLHPEVPVFHASGTLPIAAAATSGTGSSSSSPSPASLVSVDVTFRWSSDMYSDNIISFANGIRTGDGGTHVDGFRAVLTRTINAAAKKAGRLKGGDSKDSGGKLAGEFVREGLTAVVTVKVPEAEFEGQTKNRLGNPGVRSVVDQIVGAALNEAFEWHPKVGGRPAHSFIHSFIRLLLLFFL